MGNTKKPTTYDVTQAAFYQPVPGWAGWVTKNMVIGGNSFQPPKDQKICIPNRKNPTKTKCYKISSKTHKVGADTSALGGLVYAYATNAKGQTVSQTCIPRRRRPHPALRIRHQDGVRGKIHINVNMNLSRLTELKAKESCTWGWRYPMRQCKTSYDPQHDWTLLRFWYEWDYEWQNGYKFRLRNQRGHSRIDQRFNGRNHKGKPVMTVKAKDFKAHTWLDDRNPGSPYVQLSFMLHGPADARPTGTPSAIPFGPFELGLQLDTESIDDSLLTHTVLFKFNKTSVNEKIHKNGKTERQRLHDWRDRVKRENPRLYDLLKAGKVPVQGACHASEPGTYGYNAELTNKRRSSVMNALDNHFGLDMNSRRIEALSDREAEQAGAKGPNQQFQACRIVIRKEDVIKAMSK